MEIAKIVGESWAESIGPEFSTTYMRDLRDKIQEVSRTTPTYPARENIFRAFKLCPPSQVQVLILGQDPYHDGNATGLAFDVGDATRINPSLRNILKEVTNSTGECNITGGNLLPWANQGVMLLNTVLTVSKGQPRSHAGYGWEQFIAATLTALSFRGSEPLVVMLWGKDAQQYAKYFTMPNHLVLTAPHPAAEAYAGGKAGYFGCNHFQKANDFLRSHGKTGIHW